MQISEILSDRWRWIGLCFPSSRMHATPRCRSATGEALRSRSFPFSFCPARDFKRAERRARSSRLCPASRTYLAESRARPGDGTAAARSPSEVKVRRVGTGCARIHFFGLALDFFFPLFPAGEARAARHQFPCMRRRPSLHGRTRARRMHMLVCAPHVSHRLSLSLSLVLPSPFRSPVRPLHPALRRPCGTNTHVRHPSPRTRTRAGAHVCGADGTLWPALSPWLIGSERIYGASLCRTPARAIDSGWRGIGERHRRADRDGDLARFPPRILWPPKLTFFRLHSLISRTNCFRKEILSHIFRTRVFFK